MDKWVRNANCFISRFIVDPARRGEFLWARQPGRSQTIYFIRFAGCRPVRSKLTLS